jgi:hypothetical protein
MQFFKNRKWRLCLLLSLIVLAGVAHYEMSHEPRIEWLCILYSNEIELYVVFFAAMGEDMRQNFVIPYLLKGDHDGDRSDVYLS